MSKPQTVNASSATEVNFIIYQNDTWSTVMTFLDQAGDPIDFSGCTIDMQLRKTYGSAIVFELSTSSGGLVISGGGNNVVTINKLANLAAGAYLYDFEVTFSDNTVITYLKGCVTVCADVTEHA